MENDPRLDGMILNNISPMKFTTILSVVGFFWEAKFVDICKIMVSTESINNVHIWELIHSDMISLKSLKSVLDVSTIYAV